MDLRTYLKKHKLTELARALGVTPGAVHQWASGHTRIAVERCIDLEKATGGQVRCEVLRPDVDWAYLRGAAASESNCAAVADQGVTNA